MVVFVDDARATFEVCFDEVLGRLTVAAEVGGCAPIHADGNGRAEDGVGMRARAVVAFEYITQRCLNHDAGELATPQFP